MSSRFWLVQPGGFSTAAAKVVLCGVVSANWVSRSTGSFICQPGCLYLSLESDLGQKKIRTKEIHLELFCADVDYTNGLVIIYGSHNGVLHSNLLWYINKQRIREENTNALIYFSLLKRKVEVILYLRMPSWHITQTTGIRIDLIL